MARQIQSLTPRISLTPFNSFSMTVTQRCITLEALEETESYSLDYGSRSQGYTAKTVSNDDIIVAFMSNKCRNLGSRPNSKSRVRIRSEEARFLIKIVEL